VPECEDTRILSHTKRPEFSGGICLNKVQNQALRIALEEDQNQFCVTNQRTIYRATPDLWSGKILSEYICHSEHSEQVLFSLHANRCTDRFRFFTLLKSYAKICASQNEK
jgi:hypothetical protein